MVFRYLKFKKWYSCHQSDQNELPLCTFNVSIIYLKKCDIYIIQIKGESCGRMGRTNVLVCEVTDSIPQIANKNFSQGSRLWYKLATKYQIAQPIW